MGWSRGWGVPAMGAEGPAAKFAASERNEGDRGRTVSPRESGGVAGATASEARKLSAKTRASRADMGALSESDLLSATRVAEENEL